MLHVINFSESRSLLNKGGDYSRLFVTIRHYSPLFALFALFVLFVVRYSRLFAIRYSGFPDTRSPAAQVYKRKFKSEYLERQVYERLRQSEPSIEKLIENIKSDLSKLSTLSEPSIVKFIENQSEHLSKLTLYQGFVAARSKIWP